jgi:hypothetical protein
MALINPITGHYVASSEDAPSSLEHACARDVLMSAQIATGGVLQVDDEAVAHMRQQGMLGALRTLVAEFISFTRGTPVLLGDAAAALLGREEFSTFVYARGTDTALLPSLAMAHLRVATPASLGSVPARSLCRSGRDAVVYLVCGGLSAEAAALIPEDVVVVSAAAADALSPRLADAMTATMHLRGKNEGRRRALYYVPLLPCPQPAGWPTVRVGSAGWAFGEMAEGRVPVLRPGVSKQHDALRPGFNCLQASEPSAEGGAAGAAGALVRGARATAAVMGEPLFVWAWRGLLRRRCPLRSGDPEDAVQLHRRFLLLSAVTRLDRVLVHDLAPANKRAGDAVMLVDNRPDVGVVLAALCTLSRLEPGRWSLAVGCRADSNRAFMERMFCGVSAGGADFFEVCLPTAGFSMEVYNRLMKSSLFWLSVPAARVLTVQDDGLLVRPGFDQHAGKTYDYVGAPWREDAFLSEVTRGNLVGNGGLSFRRVAAMLRVCEEAERRGESTAVYPRAPHLSVPEDVFFSSGVPPERVAPRAVAAGFSAEQVWAPEGALGYHQFWRYFHVSFTERAFASLLPKA